MEKYVLIDINRIRAWFFDRKVERLIKQAKKLQKLTGYKYIVLFVAGKVQLTRKADLKKLIRMRYFRKGTTIQDLEKQALYIT